MKECISCGAPRDPHARRCLQCDTPYDGKTSGLLSGLTFGPSYVSADLTHEANVIRPEADFVSGGRTWFRPAVMGGGVIVAILIVGGIALLTSKREVKSDTDSVETASADFAPAPQGAATGVPSAQPQQLTSPIALDTPQAEASSNRLTSDAAIAFVRQYVEASSSDSNQSATSFVTDYYANQVQYFGKEVSRSDVVRDKIAYEKRWPQRSYVLDESQLTVNCGTDGVSCLVEGVMTYSVSSLERNAHGTGSAQFDLGITSINGSTKVTSESSKVVPSADVQN